MIMDENLRDKWGKKPFLLNMIIIEYVILFIFV